MSKINLKYIITVMGGVCFFAAGMAATPAQVLQRCVSKIQNAPGIYAEFTMKSSGTSATGTMRGKGGKFALVSSAGSTWYDGKDMWVYSPSSGEATVWHPSKSEITEANPLLYLSAASSFDVASGGKAQAGRTALLLTPKKRNSGLKSVKLIVVNSTSLPESIVVTAGNGSSITLTLRNIRLSASAAGSSFSFPKSKYPKARISDLR